MAPKEGYKWKKDPKTKEKVKHHIVIEPEEGWKLVFLRSRPIEGWALDYNKRLKTTCYLVGSSFLKSRSPYRAVYDQAKEYYELNRPDWTKAHRHNAAMRKMIKMWLSHLWEVWRKLEGLPTREPYIIGREGHEHYHTPQEFGWPEK
jgi:hypothetical protein